MFLIDQLKKYYSEEAFYHHAKFILLEYLQYELLDSLYKHEGSEKLSFIGGTAIRIVYGGQRFSEDLDFDNFGLSFSDFEALLEKTVKDMEYKGFEAEFRNVEKGAYHCYIKFPRLLYENKLTDHTDRKILIRVDAVSKEMQTPSREFILDKFDVYRSILTAPPEIILNQKFIAFLERKREKGRDIYDISYLMGLTSPDYNCLKRVAGIKTSKELKEKVLERCRNVDLEALAEEVRQFLLEPKKGKERILSFPEYIKQKL
ncbi:MAG: nucleotidyl transferase AbiEii/AbiGii toxin family protein [Patescibacteria group bacterium]